MLYYTTTEDINLLLVNNAILSDFEFNIAVQKKPKHSKNKLGKSKNIMYM